MALLSSSDRVLPSYQESSLLSLSVSPSSVPVFTKFSTRKKSNPRSQQSANVAERAGVTDDISWVSSGCDDRYVE